MQSQGRDQPSNRIGVAAQCACHEVTQHVGRVIKVDTLKRVGHCRHQGLNQHRNVDGEGLYLFLLAGLKSTQPLPHRQNQRRLAVQGCQQWRRHTNRLGDDWRLYVLSLTDLHRVLAEHAQGQARLPEQFNLLMPRVAQNSRPCARHRIPWPFKPLKKATIVKHQQTREPLLAVAVAGLREQVLERQRF